MLADDDDDWLEVMIDEDERWVDDNGWMTVKDDEWILFLYYMYMFFKIWCEKKNKIFKCAKF